MRITVRITRAVPPRPPPRPTPPAAPRLSSAGSCGGSCGWGAGRSSSSCCGSTRCWCEEGQRERVLLHGPRPQQRPLPTLQGFRCAADLQPALQLDLRGCRVAYKEKRGRRLQHALKVEGAAGEALLIGFPSRQQAEDWRKVWRCCSPAELGAGRWERSAAGGCRRARGWRKGRHAGGAAHAGSRPHGAWGCSVGLQCSPSPLCQVIQEVSSSSPSGPAACSPPASPCRAFGRAANPKQEEDGTRRSPSRSPTEDSKGGFLAVRLRWQRLWCAARRGALRMFPEPGGAPRRPSPRAVLRDGCDVTASGPPQRLHVARRVREFAVLQARPDEEGGAWLKSPPAKGGGSPAGANPCAETPGLGDGGRSPAAGGLLLRRIPTPNAYMDDPFGQPPASAAPRRLSSNTERLQRLQHSLDRAVRGQRRRPTSAAPGGSAAPPHGAAAVPQARQRDEGSPQLHTRDFFRSQRTLTLPPRKGTRDGLDFLTGKRAGSRLEKGGLKAGSELTLLPHRKAPAASSEVWDCGH
uniref:PH domain-containing protein n=1 Tax=Pavo cristatus TaxID=9049 RepID=A0A8C9EJT8_PAVCR